MDYQLIVLIKGGLMNIFDYAMQIEKEGEVLYAQFSKNAPNEGMTKIFTELAEQERKHYEIFKKMKENDTKIAMLSISSPGVYFKGHTFPEGFSEKLARLTKRAAVFELSLAIGRVVLGDLLRDLSGLL